MKKIFILILLLLTSCQSNDVENNGQTDDIQTNKIILALWDSLTAWYSLDLEDSYPMQLQDLLKVNLYNYEVVNAWVSWNTSLQLLERLDLYINDQETLPDVAILVIWWNDGLRWKKVEEIQANIEKIIKKLQEKNIKVVLWWMKIPPNLGLFYSRDFFKQYKKIAKNTDVYLIDFFLDEVAGYRKLNLNDGMHPNKEWYEIVSQNVFEFLEDNNLIKND